MKGDHKVLAILAVLIGFLIVGAYQLGQSRSTPAGSEGNKQAAAPAGQAAGALPGGHPPVNPAAAPSRGGELPFTHFRVGNRNVKSLLLDGDIIWIGTSGGIIRYDTKTDQHTSYDNKVPGILSNGIFHLSKLDDRLIVGTYGGGMSVLDPQSNTWRNYNIPEALADQFVYGVLRARNGDIWIATW